MHCSRLTRPCLAATLSLVFWTGPANPTGYALARPVEAAQHQVFLPLLLRPGASRPSAGVQFFAWDPTLVDSASQAGTTWLRVPLYWSLIEPNNTTPQYYQWIPALDEILAAAHEAGINVILTLKYNPEWAATYPSGPIDRVDMSELVEFVTAVMARYTVEPYDVEHLEIYNEPDNGNVQYARNGGWGFFGYQPEEYVRILSAIYAPLKAVNPKIQIVFGGMAYDRWDTENPPGPFVESFLDNVLLLGGGQYFDVMNFHYYPVFAIKWAPYGVDIIGKSAYLRDKMAAYGVSKPLMCTETSMWSDAKHGGSDELQSRYFAQVFARSAAAGLETTTWFMLVDDPDPNATKYGLLNPDKSPKPAYTAYQTWANQVSGAEFDRTLSASETGSDRIEAHAFSAHGNALLVAWTDDESTRPMSLEASRVQVVDKYGGVTTVYDGDDGQIDFKVWVDVGPSPVYLHPVP